MFPQISEISEAYGHKAALRYCWWYLLFYVYYFVKLRLWFPIKIYFKNRFVFFPHQESSR